MRTHPASALAVLALILALPAFSGPGQGSAQALALGSGDLRIEQLSDGGYHLYVRAKPGLASVLLTESTKDPALKVDSFAYRALEKNAVNGGEPRVLDGKRLGSSDLFFLVDSSPEADPQLGSAFHIFIPWVVAWGYPWSRSGRVFIHDGTFINIRTFAKPFADYSGAFADNPYLIRVSQRSSRGEARAPAVLPPAPAPGPVPPAPEAATRTKAVYDARLYIPETIAAFESIAQANRGDIRYAKADRDIAGQIDALLAREKGRSLDLVLCLDTTDTMIEGIEALKSGLPPLLRKRAADFPSFRVGIVAFKDYFEEYLYKRFDFARDLGAFASELDSLECGGGRDIPEAVFEALYAASSEFPWTAQARLVILVGDAPPHPLPRGSIDLAAAVEAASSAGVEVDAVAVPK